MRPVLMILLLSVLHHDALAQRAAPDTTGGRQLGGESRDRLDGLLRGLYQFAARGQEGQARQIPVDLVVERVSVQHGLDTRL